DLRPHPLGELHRQRALPGAGGSGDHRDLGRRDHPLEYDAGHARSLRPGLPRALGGHGFQPAHAQRSVPRLGGGDRDAVPRRGRSRHGRVRAPRPGPGGGGGSAHLPLGAAAARGLPGRPGRRRHLRRRPEDSGAKPLPPDRRRHAVRHTGERGAVVRPPGPQDHCSPAQAEGALAGGPPDRGLCSALSVGRQRPLASAVSRASSRPEIGSPPPSGLSSAEPEVSSLLPSTRAKVAPERSARFICDLRLPPRGSKSTRWPDLRSRLTTARAASATPSSATATNSSGASGFTSPAARISRQSRSIPRAQPTTEVSGPPSSFTRRSYRPPPPTAEAVPSTGSSERNSKAVRV